MYISCMDTFQVEIKLQDGFRFQAPSYLLHTLLLHALPMSQGSLGMTLHIVYLYVCVHSMYVHVSALHMFRLYTGKRHCTDNGCQDE